MKCVILCGGKGYRLREETEFRPKPMVPIGKLPIVEHVMGIYRRHGINEFILCVGYKGDMIRKYVGDSTDIRVWDTGEETATGGRIAAIQSMVESDTFCLTYGDGLGNVDLASVIRYHFEQRAILTITAVRPPSRFGQMRVMRHGLVSAFNEKPQAHSGWINGGFMVCEPGIFSYLKGDTPFEREPIQQMVSEHRVSAYKHRGFWQPMDTYAEYLYLNELWAKGNAPWTI